MKPLSLNILDLVLNSVRAKADNVSINIRESSDSNIYIITVRDDGEDMPKWILENVHDTCSSCITKQWISPGLPLLKYHAELTGGRLEIDSQQGRGTEVRVLFAYSHVDRQPLGDIVGILTVMIAANPAINFNYLHITEKGEYNFSTIETKKYLEVDSLADVALLDDIGCMIGENLMKIEVSGFVYKEKVRQ